MNFNIERELYKQVEKGIVKVPLVCGTYTIWDFGDVPAEAQSEIRSSGRPPVLPVPNCKQEFERYQQIIQLRNKFDMLVKERLDIFPPKECFNRWLFDQLAIPRKEEEKINMGELEPLLRNPDIAKDSKVLHQQLLENLPSSTEIPWGKRDREDIRREKYIEYTGKSLYWVTKWLAELQEEKEKLAAETKDTETPENERLKGIDAEIQELNVCSKQLKDIREDLKDYRGELRALFGTVKQILQTKAIQEKFCSIIDKVVEDIVEETNQSITKIRGKTQFVLEENKVVVETDIPGDFVEIFYDENKLRISKLHYHKLRILFSIHNIFPTLDDEAKAQFEGSFEMTPEQKEQFHRALYVLARRYATFFGENEGAAFHAAAPESNFDVMRNEFSVVQELFASPFNCHFAKFCSAFPDIDCWFGSYGSFFDFYPESGSFEVGPPYTVEVMDQMAERLMSILGASTKPLSFIVFVPEWRRPIAKYHVLMDDSPYTRENILVNGHEYAYVVGDQHTASSRYFSLPFDTRVYFLQNELGAKKWPITPQHIEHFRASLATPLDKQLKKRNQPNNSRNYPNKQHRGNNYRGNRGGGRRY